MRSLSLFVTLLFTGLILSCNSSPSDNSSLPVSVDTIQKENFFPVTSFIQGEIYSIKNGGVTPTLYSIKNGVKDSGFVKMENLDSLVAPFLKPMIDTSNLKSTFTETSFLDETLKLFTFNYTRKPNKSEVPELKTWNVYLGKEDSKVKSVYIEKIPSPGVKLLLTWKAGKYCQMVTIENDKVVEERIIKWTYDNDEE